MSTELITTTEARAALRRAKFHPLYTNRWKNSGDERSVKAYISRNGVKGNLAALKRLIGEDAVTVTRGSPYSRMQGVIVRCYIAK